MGFLLKGDWDRLGRAISQLKREVGPRVMFEATAEAKTGVFDQYQSDFSGHRDPWGNAWKPSRHSMVRTSALANPTITTTTGKIRVKPERYWVFHQAGTAKMPARPVFPYGASTWDRPIQSRIESVVSRYINRLTEL